LKIRIKSLGSGRNTLSLPIEAGAVPQETAKLASNGRLELSIVNKGASLAGEARATVPVHLECSRCLKAYREEIEFEFSFTAKPEKADALASLDDNVLFYALPDGELDLLPLLLEEAAVNMPMKPVCREDCRGICGGCGRNLNKEACQCQAPAPNPAWEALLKLKRSE
jgi:uncharacterized protein